MRMIGMPGVLRQVAKLDALRLSEEARRRLAVVERVEYARSRGMSVVDACRVVGSSPASYDRYRKLLERFGPRGLEPKSRRPRRVRKCRGDALRRPFLHCLRRRLGIGRGIATPLPATAAWGGAALGCGAGQEARKGQALAAHLQPHPPAPRLAQHDPSTVSCHPLPKGFGGPSPVPSVSQMY